MNKNQRLYKKWFRRVYGRKRHSKREYKIAATKNRHIFDRMTRLSYQMAGKPVPRNGMKRSRKAMNRLATVGFRDLNKAISLINEVMQGWGSAMEAAS